VSLLDINFDGFSSAKLYQQRISRLHVVIKKIYNFPEKSELPKFILLVKISWLIFLRFLGWKWKICWDQSRLNFLPAWFCACSYAARASASMCSSRKYPYLPHRRDFFQDPPPLWKFQLNLIHFFKFFGLREPPTPQEIPIPSVGGVRTFSGTAHYKTNKSLAQ